MNDMSPSQVCMYCMYVCLCCRCTLEVVTGSVADTKQSTQHEYSDEVLIVGMETSKHERVGDFCSQRFAFSLSFMHVQCLLLEVSV